MSSNLTAIQVPAADYVPTGIRMGATSAEELLRFVNEPAPIITDVRVDRWFAWYPVTGAFSGRKAWLQMVTRYTPSNAPRWYLVGAF